MPTETKATESTPRARPRCRIAPWCERGCADCRADRMDEECVPEVAHA